MASETDRIAQVWPGWRTEELIGRGGFGSVYRASRTVADHISTAAVKIIDMPSDASDIKELRSMGMDDASIHDYFAQAARSLLNEIAAMDSLKGSANIVQIEDYQLREQKGGPGWTVFIRMELLESLEAYQERTGLPDQWETARIGVQISSALARCHAIGIIHRDVKPANIFRNKFGDYKLGDFGIAKNLENATRSNMSFAGTRPFMAPEVEGGRYDKSVDTYSLGIMLYRWLNGGRPPFLSATGNVDQADLHAAQLRRLSGERPPLPAGGGVDPALASIVARACEPDPKDRWSSARELGRALQSWLDGHPAPADAATASSAISTDAVSSMDRPAAEPIASSPSASVPSAPHQDYDASTVDFKSWLGGEQGELGSVPMPQPAPQPVSKPEPIPQPVPQPAPQPVSNPKSVSKPEPEPKPILKSKKAASRKASIFLISAIGGISYAFARLNIWFIMNGLFLYEAFYAMPSKVLGLGLIFFFRGFAFTVWALLVLESAQSLWQKILTVFAVGSISIISFQSDLVIVDSAQIFCSAGIRTDINYWITFLVATIGPIGSLVNYLAKKFRKTEPAYSSGFLSASLSELASTAGPLTDEVLLRKMLRGSCILSIIVAILTATIESANGSLPGFVPVFGITAGCHCFISFIWALLALQATEKQWQKILDIILAALLSLYLRGPFIYIGIETFVFLTLQGIGPIGSIINFIAKKIRKSSPSAG